MQKQMKEEPSKIKLQKKPKVHTRVETKKESEWIVLDEYKSKDEPVSANTKENILWIGTSLSDQHLDVNMLSLKTNTEVKKVKAFTIVSVDGKYDPKKNVEDVANEELDKKTFDIVVVEVGVNEVSNLNLRMAPHLLQQEMKEKMEKLHLLAVQWTMQYPELRVVLLERVERIDSDRRASQARGADQAMWSWWEANGRPENIILERLKLQTLGRKERDEVFGRLGEQFCDGVHLRGKDGGKEFTHRAANLVRRVLRVRAKTMGPRRTHGPMDRATQKTKRPDERMRAVDKRKVEAKRNHDEDDEERKKYEQRTRNFERRRREEDKRKVEVKRRHDEEWERYEQRTRDFEMRRREDERRKVASKKISDEKKIVDEEKLMKEKQRRLNILKEKEEQSKKRIRANRMRDDERRKREERMRKSDEKQQSVRVRQQDYEKRKLERETRHALRKKEDDKSPERRERGARFERRGMGMMFERQKPMFASGRWSREWGDSTLGRNKRKEARREGIEPRKEGREPMREGREHRREGMVPRRNGMDPKREGREPRREGWEPRREGWEPKREGRVHRMDGRESRREWGLGASHYDTRRAIYGRREERDGHYQSQYPPLPRAGNGRRGALAPRHKA